MTNEKKTETAKEAATVKKAMISQPMAGKTDEEIVATRDLAVAKLRQMGYEVVNTLFTDEWYSDEAMKERGVVQVPLCFLAKSLENMSLCHAAYFCKGWEDARGCKIEHDAATAYGLEVLYEEERVLRRGSPHDGGCREGVGRVLRAGVPPSGEGDTQAGEATRPEVAAPLSPRASAIAPQQPVPEKHRKVPMMIDDATRNSVADQLEHDAVYLDGSSLSEWWARLQSVACNYEDFPDPRSLFTRLAGLIRPNPINGSTSDGYHTFDELYHHRAVLFSVVVSAFPDKAWKAKAHSDGTMYGDMFIVGIDTPDGQATYHYDIDPYWGMFRCKELDRAPEWDGHTPEQAIERIGKLTGLIDRATTHLVLDEDGRTYCPDCGAKVAKNG